MTWSTESVSTQSKKQKKGKPNTFRRSRRNYSGRKISRPSKRHRVSIRRHSKGSLSKVPPPEIPLGTGIQEKDWTLNDDWFDCGGSDDEGHHSSSFVRNSWERKPFKSKDKLPPTKDESEPESVIILDCQLKEPPAQAVPTYSHESQSNVVFHTRIHLGKDRVLPEGRSIKSLLGVNCQMNAPEKSGKLPTESEILSRASSKDTSAPKDDKLSSLSDEKEQVSSTIKLKEAITESHIVANSMDQLIIDSIDHSPVSLQTCRMQMSTSSESLSHDKHVQVCSAEVHPSQPQCLRNEEKDSIPVAKTTQCNLELSGNHFRNGQEEESGVKSIRNDPESISLSDIEVNIDSLTETLRTLNQEYDSLEKPSERRDIHRTNSTDSLTNSTSVSTITDATSSANTTLHSTSSGRLSRLSKYSICARRPRTKRIRICVARRPRKILILGDMMSGKTNLVSSYSMDRYQDQYIPTLLRCVQTDATVQGEAINLVVLDISGRDDFAPLRKCAYHKVDAVIMCYPVDSVDSLERIRTYWVRELKQHAPKAQFVVVGTKKDIRDEARDGVESLKRTLQGAENEMEGRIRLEADFAEKFVSFDRGKRLSKEIGALGFYECSSMYREGTRNLFESIAKIAMQKSRRKRRTSSRHVDNMCTIL